MKHSTGYYGRNAWFRVTLATLVLSLGANARIAGQRAGEGLSGSGNQTP